MKSHAANLLIGLCVAISCFLIAIPRVFAEPPPTPPTDLKTMMIEKFKGINFGVALTLTLDTGSHDRVESAEVVNGIVRVTEEKNDIPRIMLETHYYFLPERELPFFGVLQNMWGWGPFVGFQNGANEVIESIGAGLMIGVRRAEEKSDCFNIGIGAVVDPSVKILGDGINENQPLPDGEDKVRYKETSQWGVLIMIAYAF